MIKKQGLKVVMLDCCHYQVTWEGYIGHPSYSDPPKKHDLVSPFVWYVNVIVSFLTVQEADYSRKMHR